MILYASHPKLLNPKLTSVISAVMNWQICDNQIDYNSVCYLRSQILFQGVILLLTLLYSLRTYAFTSCCSTYSIA